MNRLFVEHWISLYLGLIVCTVFFLSKYFTKKRGNKKYPYRFYVNNFNLPRSKLYSFVRNASSLVLMLAALVLLFASMGVSRLTMKNYVKDENRYVLFAIDVSPSMAIYDVGGRDRLSVAKDIVREFLFSNHGAYVGVLVFAQSLRMLIPFSQDYNAIAQLMTRVGIGELGDDSALGDALLYSENVLSALQQGSTKRDLVFISDGVQNSGNVALSDIQQHHFDSSMFFIRMGGDNNGHFKYKDVMTKAVVQGYIKPFKSVVLSTLAQKIHASYTQVENIAAIPTIVGSMSVRHTDLRTLVSRAIRVDLTEYFLLLFVVFCALFVLLRYGIIRSL